MQKKFPTHTLNNTTVSTLGNSEAVIEVFPPEIFFKGKFLEGDGAFRPRRGITHTKNIIFEIKLTVLNIRYRAKPDL